MLQAVRLCFDVRDLDASAFESKNSSDLRNALNSYFQAQACSREPGKEARMCWCLPEQVFFGTPERVEGSKMVFLVES